MAPINQTNGSAGSSPPLTNYVAYRDPATSLPRIGHLETLNDDNSAIRPLAFTSGTPIPDLYAVIEAGSHSIIAAPGEESVPLSSVILLAPISGRDVLAVGKNYADHAVEFNSSGFDSSDKVDQPTHPVIFSKRATSIVASGTDIFPHPGFTESLDYEGELGVIIGKSGFKIDQANAMDYVWGYTIINDMTARERQRDHKQFYIGKSPDTFCPMGPVAVPKEQLTGPLRLQTKVNGTEKQNATTDLLIFSIPFLVKTLSEGQTLSPGDIIATGTPAGVGIGKNPPVYLNSGDIVEVSITGLGTLKNRIAQPSDVNPTVERVAKESHVPIANKAKSLGVGIGLTNINGKQLFYQKRGADRGTPIVFVHGLGGTNTFYDPLISALQLDKTNELHLFDLEGHGLSPSSALSPLSIASFAKDVKGVFDHAGLAKSSGSILIAHSMGCLVALQFVVENPGLVDKLVLVGPPPSPLPEAASKGSFARANLARSKGMSAVVDAVATAGTSEYTKAKNGLALAAVRISLLGQDPEGYAKACKALAEATTALPLEKVAAHTFILTGSEDKVSPPDLCRKMKGVIPKCDEPVVLDNVGHWHLFEDPRGAAEALRSFLG